MCQRIAGCCSASASRAALPHPAKPSIAILPFQNMSGDPEQEYFADRWEVHRTAATKFEDGTPLGERANLAAIPDRAAVTGFLLGSGRFFTPPIRSCAVAGLR